MDLTSTADQRPLLQRLIEFPLVVMVIAIGLVAVALAVAVLLAGAAYAALPRISYAATSGLVAIALLIAVYKRAIRHLGANPRDDLRAARAFRLLAMGIGTGLIIFSMAVAIAAAIGVYRITGEGDGSSLSEALIVSAAFPAVSEEMLFRGIIFRWLEEWGGSWIGLILSSLAFGFVHYFNTGATVVACLWIAIEAGLMLGAAYMLTRSLWLPMGIHAGWNFAEGEIYGIPVSGTTAHGLLHARLSGPPLLTGDGFGLEGSLTTLLAGTIFGLGLLWLAVGRGEIMRPIWAQQNR